MNNNLDYITSRSTEDIDTGCWNWNRALSKGYGVCRGRIGDKYEQYAHRYSFYLYNGYEANFACHKCNNKKCVNPTHIYDGDVFTNARDSIDAGTQIKGEQVNTAVLTEDEVILIRKLYESGVSRSEIRGRFPISKSALGSILRRETWKHLL